MATQVGGIFIGLDLAAQGFNTKIDLANRKINQFTIGSNASLAKVATQSKTTAAQLNRLNAVNISRISGSVASLGTSIKSLAAIGGLSLGTSSLIQYSDAAIRVSNALKVAGLAGEEMRTVYSALFESAQRNAAPLEALVQLYGRVSMVQRELGVSTAEMLKFTDNVAVALRVSGKSAQESSGALNQFSQAMGSGIVRAEEFNSILEGALPIAQAAAAGIEEAGGSVAKLRELVVEGKVSSAAFFRGFEAGAVILRDKVATSALTTAQAITQLQNALINAAGRFDAVFGASARAAQSLGTLADIINIAAANAEKAKGPYDEFATALHGARSEAESLVGWLEKASRLNIPGNVARYVYQNFKNFDRTSPALPPISIDDMAGENPVPLSQSAYPDESGRGLAVARFAQKVNTVSIKDFPVNAKSTASANAEADAFDRATRAIERRTAMLQADVSAIGLSESARARLRVEAELTTAAIQKNRDEGKTNTAVTQEQAKKNQGAC